MTNLESLDNGQWQEIPYDDLAGDKIESGQLVTGVPTITAFRKVERAILDRLCKQSEQHECSEAIVNKTVENLLRPPKFNGNLLAGRVAVMSFQDSIAQKHDSTLKGTSRLDNLEDAFTVIYMGELEASRVGQLGGIILETTYRKRNGANRNHIVRTMGPLETEQDVEAILRRRDEQSALNWGFQMTGLVE